MLNRPLSFAALALCATPLLGGADCEGDGPSDGGPEPDAGPAPVVIIGDQNAPAEFEFVFRDVDGVVKPLLEGQEIPLILPPQGGKVVYVGVRAKNITSNVQVNGGFFDDCRDPPVIFGRDARPIRLIEGADGFGEPENNPGDPFVANLVNVPVCPAFVAVRDGDGYPTRFEIRVTEQRRPGEDENRTYVLTGTVRPVCGAEAEVSAECFCECDSDYTLGGGEVDCATINDNDLERGVCPELPAEGEGEGEEGEGEGEGE